MSENGLRYYDLRTNKEISFLVHVPTSTLRWTNLVPNGFRELYRGRYSNYHVHGSMCNTNWGSYTNYNSHWYDRSFQMEVTC